MLAAISSPTEYCTFVWAKKLPMKKTLKNNQWKKTNQWKQLNEKKLNEKKGFLNFFSLFVKHFMAPRWRYRRRSHPLVLRLGERKRGELRHAGPGGQGVPVWFGALGVAQKVGKKEKLGEKTPKKRQVILLDTLLHCWFWHVLDIFDHRYHMFLVVSLLVLLFCCFASWTEIGKSSQQTRN